MADAARPRGRSSAVLGLLSEEGRSKGRLIASETAAHQTEADKGGAPIDGASANGAEPAPVSASVTSPAEAPQSPQQATRPAASKEQPVSQTVRVTSTVAKTLRDAWLEERRQGDVLLSYTDFATRIVLAGLDALGKKSRPRR